MSKLCYEASNEETLLIDLPDTKQLKLKAILRGSLAQPVVVLVHGLPGNGNDLLPYLGARYLHEQGFASLRLFLYSWDDNARDLADCTLETHVRDFDVAVKYLKDKNVSTIFAVGHSYGGLTILKSSSKLDGAVLWDPSQGEVFTALETIEYFENGRIELTDRFKLFLNGPGYIEPLAITKEQDEMGDNSSDAARKGYPLKIISAGKGQMVDLHKKYITNADEPKRQVVIKRAGHTFDDSDMVMKELFSETAKWFEEIIND